MPLKITLQKNVYGYLDMLGKMNQVKMWTMTKTNWWYNVEKEERAGGRKKKIYAEKDGNGFKMQTLKSKARA